MKWVRVFTVCKALREGIVRGGGQVSLVENLSPDAYDAIIYYKIMPQATPRHVKLVNMNKFTQLQSFTTGIATELYRLGLLE